MPRPRFTLRWLMVAVAIVGASLGWVAERRSRFRGLALVHNAAYEKSLPIYARGRPGVIVIRDPLSLGEWHFRMWQKYALAARYPWLPVAPDPPEPE